MVGFKQERNSKQVVFALLVFGFLKEFCTRLQNREMFSKPGRAKIGTNPSEIENWANIRHKSVMLSALQLIVCLMIESVNDQ